ncbi:hypothetical protein J6W78_00520 [bacterium]|nr:hypothetical protein [bacterium]
MKKLFFILACFLTVFILSCGGSGTGGSGKTCESNLDCPVGEICSSGTCVTKGSNGGGSQEGENGEISDGENGNGSGNGNSNDGETTDDSDSTNADEPENGICTPGETQKCEYQGAEGTEDVGPCKAAVRTCKEDGTWGKCEGAVEPILENTNELCSNGIDDDCDGIIDNGIDNICKGGSAPSDDEEPEEEDDSDVAHCDTTCNTLIEIENNGCLSPMASEAEADLCNGQDDDCDGKIDEGCPCTPGATQACFSGKPANRHEGTCHDGIQTCKSTPMRAATGDWGNSKCIDEILPSKDVCDNVDNNCNGCVDEGLCCQPPIDCSFDIGTAKPFEDKLIDGKQIYDSGHQFNDADTATWEWTLVKGPCDVVLGKTSFSLTSAVSGVTGTSTDAEKSITFSGKGLSQFKVNFQLSGTYNLHLKVTRENGEIYECDWPLKVVSTGLRVELCWDSNTKVDVDLHVGKNGTTTTWGSDDCYFSNCRNGSSPNWYTPTSSSAKNPRLDIDNRGDGPIPENINIDNPGDGHAFRVGAYYHPILSTDNIETHAVVNIYCGGTRKATYGYDPLPQLSGFNKKNDFWKVAEIKWVGGYESDNCDIQPKLIENEDGTVNYVIDRPRNSTYSNW